MSQLVFIRRALISVSNKTDLIPFAKGLVDQGVEIISTGGTARALSEAGVDVLAIDQVTGFPEMMDGRVKTLHPAIHGALLARRDIDSHVSAMDEHDITPIDLVCVNLYPFEQTIIKDGITRDEAIEQIDIGGPSMLRSAAKNHQFVTVVTNPNQYDRVINEIRSQDGATSIELRRDLAAAAFSRTAEYDTTISAWMASKRPEKFPSMLRMAYAHIADLRYGENPHQQAALYSNPASPDPSIVRAESKHGKPLSYNNVNDASAALELVRDLNEFASDQAAAAIIKHTNPCGAAIADCSVEAFERAYAGDPLAAFGGILAMNRTIDKATAEAICDGQKFLEVIIAPGYADDAMALLCDRWKNVRLLDIDGLERNRERKIDYRSIPGGMLVQERDLHIPNTDQWIHSAGPKPSEAALRDAAFVVIAAKHLKSNAIAIGDDGRILGVGTGQVDRVAACRLAVEKSGEKLNGASFPIAAGDAFFPFNDGPQILIDAGVKMIVHPGGSKRDSDTFELCDKHDVICMTTGTRHFRH